MWLKRRGALTIPISCLHLKLTLIRSGWRFLCVCWESNNYISAHQQTGHIVHLSQADRVPVDAGEH